MTSGAGPYLGLRPFEANDAPFFFGRKRESELLAANLRTSRASLVYGESGVGKSSLIRAGLAPLLSRLSDATTHDEHEGETIAAVVVPLAGDSSASTVPREIVRTVMPANEQLVADISLLDAITLAVARVDRLLVVLDQFEEYLAYGKREENRQFGKQMLSAVADAELPVHFMLTIREDSISKLDQLGRRARELSINPIRVEPLTEEAVREAIRGPLEVYNERHNCGWAVDPAFEDVVMDATRIGNVDLGFGGRGGLSAQEGRTIEAAYLQVVLEQMWIRERADGSEVLSLETFNRLGGVEGIVRAHLDNIMGSISRDDQGVAAAAFRYLVTPSGMKVPYSAWDLAELTDRNAADIERVLSELAKAERRIVRPLSPSPRGDARYEIFHDRLADPILDWRVRRERGGGLQTGIRYMSVFTSLLAFGLAIVQLARGGSMASIITLVVTGLLYAVVWRLPGVMQSVESYERVVRRLTQRIMQRSRSGKADRSP